MENFERRSDLDEGEDWGKGMPMTKGGPTHYEPISDTQSDTIDVLVVGQPQYKRTRAGQVLTFEGEFEFDKEKQRADFTVWEDKLDLVREDLARGDVIHGLLRNGKQYKGRPQFTLEPVEKRNPTDSSGLSDASSDSEEQPEGEETRGREERSESPTTIGELYEIKYETAPISFRSPVNFQQISKIVHRGFTDAYQHISGIVEEHMTRLGIPTAEFPLAAVVAAAQAGGATVSIACTNGLVTISRERKTRRQDRSPALEARDIAEQAKQIAERLHKRNLASGNARGEENEDGE